MKRTYIAASILAVSAHGALAAQPQVQLYGSIDEGVTHFNGLSNGAGGTTSSTGLSSGVQSTSVIGLKGRENLGNGLTVLFEAETGFCAAGNNQDLTTAGKLNSGALGPQTYCSGNSGVSTGGGFMQNEAYVALITPIGFIGAGQGAPMAYRNEKLIDPFHAGLTGTITNMSLVGQYGDLHQNQGVTYLARFGALSGGASYSFAPIAGGTIPTQATATPSAANATSRVTRAYSLFARYQRGPLLLGGAYAVTENLPVPAMLEPRTFVNDGSLIGLQAYGAYDFGVAKISAVLEQSSADHTSGHARVALVGLDIPLGRGNLLLSWVRASTDQGMEYVNLQSLSLASRTALYGKANQYALGYTYALSKTTDLYASYAHIANGAHTNFAVGSASDGFIGAMGQASSGVALGVHHDF